MNRRRVDKDKFAHDFALNRTEKRGSKVRAIERELGRLEAIDRPKRKWTLHFQIPISHRSGDVARLPNAFVERGTFKLGPIDLVIAWRDRISIDGPNGSGKTTLLDTILAKLPLVSGERWFGPGVVVGEIGQSRSNFDNTRTLLEEFPTKSQLSLSESRTLLAKFGLSADHVIRSIGTLSSGERTRAELALLMAREVNFLVLDQPTNHLDIEAIEELERVVASWDGTLLLVTHDRRFLDNVRIQRSITLPSSTG